MGGPRGPDASSGSAGRHARPLGRRLVVAGGRHWLFLVVFTLAAVLRAMVQITYAPAIFFPDSYRYLEHAVEPEPDTQRPLGYSVLFVRPLLVFHDLAVIPLVQHLLGLGMAVVIYATLIRHRAPAWLAALAAAPVLLDGYQLQIEENIASDTFYQALVVGALALLVWHRRPPSGAVWMAGILVGTGATVRFVGLPLAIVPVVFALVVGGGWRRRVARGGLVALGAALPLLVYCTWTYAHTGEFRPGGDRSSGRALEARVAAFADCRALARGSAPEYVVQLCPDEPPAERPQSPRYYMRQSLFGTPDIDLPPGVELNSARREFAIRVVMNQPLDFAKVVLRDFSRGFAWRRTTQPGDWPLATWTFNTEISQEKVSRRSAALNEYGGSGPNVKEEPATFLHAYQSLVYSRGPILALGIVAPVLSVALGRPRTRGLSAPSLLISVAAVTLLLASASFAFSWRYQLPAVPLLPWAAAFGLLAVLPRLRRRTPGQHTAAAVDLAASRPRA